MDSQHFLVPIKVQALVIDDEVINRRGAIDINAGTKPPRYAANAGRWSPQLYDYARLNSLTPPGPKPFYGATHNYKGNPAEQLVLDTGLPQNKDRGVYLRWILPSGLRHAYTPGLLDFPAVPNQWLIVRFARRGATLKTKAWFVEGGKVVSGGPANLVFGEQDKYVAKRVGRVVPMEEFASANFSEEGETITALGNPETGSPTFTAFIAENRNIFSWHDALNDLREPNAEGSVPRGTTLSYSLIGWYRKPKDEPLRAPAAELIEQRDEDSKLLGWLIDPPGWFIAADSTRAGDLLKRRSVFHGTVAHINYWSPTYQGQMLGYPGSPSVPGATSKSTPAFQVGIGNSAEDALVSLVSGSYSGGKSGSILADEQPDLWKALEAVIYRQTESLVGNWSAAPSDLTVHQNWFATRDAGKLWFIRPRADREPVFPKDPNQTAKQAAIEPTPDQLTRLAELNRKQSEVDALSRELAALQQDLYARWWKLCAKSRKFPVKIDAEQKECETVAGRVKELRTKRREQLDSLQRLEDELRDLLPKEELELKYDAAPRFWTPADPVVVVKNCGRPTKHRSPRQLSCRLPEQIVTAGEVVVDQDPKQFNVAAGVAEIAAAAQKHLPACPQILTGLLKEASLVEQAIGDLAARTLPPVKEFADTGEWRRWTERLVNDLEWDGDPESYPADQVNFGQPNALNIRPHRLAELWIEQPWSPLFIDWQITWFPTTQAATPEHPFGPTWTLAQADFAPLDRQSIPKTGYTMRGRSLLSPIDERIFKEPIDTLRDLLRPKKEGTKDETSVFTPMVREIFQRYETVWDDTLSKLRDAGLMGQALTGFHQALLQRDVTLPRITPDPQRPWINVPTLQSLEDEVRTLLATSDKEGLTGERLAPPGGAATTTERVSLPFSMIRSGALRIDELWLIDDFGQSADLLGLTASLSRSTGQVFHPRIRWHNDQSVFAMPPRVLQPVRLNFRFTAGEQGVDEEPCEPAIRPVSGWIFYNPLDQALVLCDRNGQLMGHLVIARDQGGTRINWEAGAGGVVISKIPNPDLRAFAESLNETMPSAKPRLLDLLKLIDSALARIRPATGRRDSVLVGRPLALVNATIGLELFGKSWTDPDKSAVAREGTGNETLDALRVQVKLGYARSIEDGLVGYFKAGDPPGDKKRVLYNRIVATQLSDKLPASDYLRDRRTDPLRVGFGAPQQITLLMDPWGSVQAACGIVPAKTITMAHAELDQVVTQMEASFRVGPVLLHADRIALPTPAGEKGSWNFYGPLTDQKTAAVAPLDPGYFSDKPVVATEGRLLLLNEE
jgi:hypothetical protein